MGSYRISIDGMSISTTENSTWIQIEKLSEIDGTRKVQLGVWANLDDLMRKLLETQLEEKK